MAKAELNFKTKTKQVVRQVVDVQEVKKVSGVTLTLTRHEARTLNTILRLVGGDPEFSLRSPAERIRDALKEVGVGYYVGHDGLTSSTLCVGADSYLIFRDDSDKQAKLVGDNLPKPEEVRTGPTVVDREPRFGDRIRIVSTESSDLFKVGDTGTITNFCGRLGAGAGIDFGPRPAMVRFDKDGLVRFCGSYSRYEILT